MRTSTTLLCAAFLLLSSSVDAKKMKFKQVGKEGFATTPMSTAGGVKLAARGKAVYALVHSKTITSPSSELTVYELKGNDWSVLGKGEFAKGVSGADIEILPDGTVLVLCSKTVYRYDPESGKFRMGLGTGRGYAGFSWGMKGEDPHNWEKDMGYDTLADLEHDGKGREPRHEIHRATQSCGHRR